MYESSFSPYGDRLREMFGVPRVGPENTFQGYAGELRCFRCTSWSTTVGDNRGTLVSTVETMGFR